MCKPHCVFSVSANGPNLPMVQSERVQILGKAKSFCQVSVHHTFIKIDFIFVVWDVSNCSEEIIKSN